MRDWGRRMEVGDRVSSIDVRHVGSDGVFMEKEEGEG